MIVSEDVGLLDVIVVGSSRRVMCRSWVVVGSGFSVVVTVSVNFSLLRRSD